MEQHANVNVDDASLALRMPSQTHIKVVVGIQRRIVNAAERTDREVKILIQN